MTYEPYDVAQHEGPARRAERMSDLDRAEADPERERWASPYPVISSADEVDELLEWAVRRIHTLWFADDRVIDWDDFLTQLEDYAEVAVIPNSAATRRIRQIVREERRDTR